MGEVIHNHEPVHGSSLPYIVAIIIMTCVTLIATSLLLVFSPDKKHIEFFTLLSIFIVPTTMSLLGLLKSSQAYNKSNDTFHMVNSRLDEFIRNASMIAEAKGHRAGLQEGRESANIRTDQLNEQQGGTPPV